VNKQPRRKKRLSKGEFQSLPGARHWNSRWRVGLHGINKNAYAMLVFRINTRKHNAGILLGINSFHQRCDLNGAFLLGQTEI